MLSKNVIAASLLLASVPAAFAAPQAEVSIVLGINDEDFPVSGSDLDAGAVGHVAGAGPDGTTYVFSVAETYTDSDESTTETSTFATTITAVQDATHVSYAIVASGDANNYREDIQCGFDSTGNGACTQVFVISDTLTTDTETITTSGSILALPVSITGSASVSGSTSTSGGSSRSTNGSSSGGSTASAGSSNSGSDSSASTIVISGFASFVASLVGIALVI